MGSSLRFSWAILHDGVIRRSADEAALRIKSGTSLAVVRGGGGAPGGGILGYDDFSEVVR